MDERGRVVEAAQAMAGQPRACVACAARAAWRTGAVGYQRSRLAGGAEPGEGVPDRHDRRRQQRVDGAVCGARFHGGEHALVVGLPGLARASGGVLHRQGELVSGEPAVALQQAFAGARTEHADPAGTGGVGDRAYSGRIRRRPRDASSAVSGRCRTGW